MFDMGADNIGVTPALGVFDPLGLIETRYMRRYDICMEINHGRAAMLGSLGVVAAEFGLRLPGYLAPSAGLKFSDMPGGALASWAALPGAGWLQIMVDNGRAAMLGMFGVIVHEMLSVDGLCVTGGLGGAATFDTVVAMLPFDLLACCCNNNYLGLLTIVTIDNCW